MSGKTAFDYHKELHYSQTGCGISSVEDLFDYHKELHYSQTGPVVGRQYTV